MFGVSKAKYLKFNTPDESALRQALATSCPSERNTGRILSFKNKTIEFQIFVGDASILVYDLLVGCLFVD